MKSEEVNYKKNFCEKYFDKNCWDLDVLNQVDVLLKDKKGNFLLYIEAKFLVASEKDRKSALAQVILTNKKQASILSRVALIYQDSAKNDVLELIDCSENSVMYNNDINWNAEKPSNPTKDAIDRINDRIKGKITVYTNEEIKEFYKKLKNGLDTEIDITEHNFNVVYNQWKNEIRFKEKIEDEQDLINLFLVDILNGTKYKKAVTDAGLFGSAEDAVVERVETTDKPQQVISTGSMTETSALQQDLIREGTNLSHYEIIRTNEKIRILYEGKENSVFYTIADSEKYAFFWKKYKRPPEKNEFLKILERSATLYSEKYRKDTGGEYTPSCFVEKQNEILRQHYNLDEFIVCDPCAGVGNLENQFGKDFKQYCYLSTLEPMDVDICKIKGFENAVQFDYLKNAGQPKWKYKGTPLDINEICRRENRKLMIVMNPPYQKKAGFKNNLAIEFFNKVLKLNPDVIVFYYMTESFLRDEIENYKKSGYKIVSHIFSNAKTTFMLSEWPISQIIFDKEKGIDINDNEITAERYELQNGRFNFINSYTYNDNRPGLIYKINDKIIENETGLVLGNYSYMTAGYSINLTNKTNSTKNHITQNNIYYCLLSKGLIFNTHNHYFERNQYVHKGEVSEISDELKNDAIMMALFYKNCAFTNKGQKNYVMPFTSEELGCAKNDLNVLFPQEQEPDLFSSVADTGNNKGLKSLDSDRHSERSEESHSHRDSSLASLPQNGSYAPFDFRQFLSQFDFSVEAKDLYAAALEIFRFYHKSEEYAQNRDWNDSFYDITNAIMGKDASSFKVLETDNDTRITRTKTTKGTKGFGRNTIKYAVSSVALPIFERFFDARDVLAKKINRQLVESGLLLWERENIY